MFVYSFMYAGAHALNSGKSRELPVSLTVVAAVGGAITLNPADFAVVVVAGVLDDELHAVSVSAARAETPTAASLRLLPRRVALNMDIFTFRLILWSFFDYTRGSARGIAFA